MITLSRLNITGQIHQETPLCVLNEIAYSHCIHSTAITKKNLVKLINEKPPVMVKDIDNSPGAIDLQYIARFVSNAGRWEFGKLRLAFKFLLQFMNKDDPLLKIPINFEYGQQDPENPYRINACILYKTCLYHRLNVNKLTTIDQLAFAVRMLRGDIESIKRRALKFVQDDANKTNLINILLLSPQEIPDPEPPELTENVNYSQIPNLNINHELFDKLYKALTDVNELRGKINPTTSAGSVALAALKYGIDISYSKNPIREYSRLKLLGRDGYVPGDEWLLYWYNKNKKNFDLLETFSPYFPKNYYEKNQLRVMAINEGFTQKDFNSNDYYNLLHENYRMETFYEGELPNLNSDTLTIDFEPISELPAGELLCYGVKEEKLQPISINELLGSFNYNRNFSNPLDNNGLFSQRSINKLKIILQNQNYDVNTNKLREQLLKLIIDIEKDLNENDGQTRQLIFTYHNASQDTKNAIIDCLQSLVKAGMYMRGWVGPGDVYPLEETYVAEENQMYVQMNSEKAIYTFQSKCKSLGRIGNQIMDLPLVEHKDGSYNPSTDIEKGLTIFDRISIILQGDKAKSIHSCIRMSSNWICASGHKYLTALGAPPPFDIFKLRKIA